MQNQQPGLVHLRKVRLNYRVITSYSIHYTKLYDVQVIKGLGKDVPYYIKSEHIVTSEEMLEKALELGERADIIISCAAISDYAPETDFKGRITSYNVCYTKLLRPIFIKITIL